MQGRLDKLQNEFSGVASNLRKVQSFLAPKEKLSNQVNDKNGDACYFGDSCFC